LHVHYHWVTDAGDMIFLDDADAPTFPTACLQRVITKSPITVDLGASLPLAEPLYFGAAGFQRCFALGRWLAQQSQLLTPREPVASALSLFSLVVQHGLASSHLLRLSRRDRRGRCWGRVPGQHPDLPIITLLRK
jgi:hypothetical protein